ncbi:hypothetical protein EAF04_005640 [Stromatinia cepivora]|nr:hypothetical protein EAF04_005640 [Stromatinia cepivora]
MSIQYGREPLRREKPPRVRDDPLTRPPNFPPTPPGRDRLSPEARSWEESLDALDKQLDYEDIHGPGTSQHAGSTWEYIPSDPPIKDIPRRALLDEEKDRIMFEVKRDFAAQGRTYRLALSESSESSEEEKVTDFRSFVNVTRKRDAREHARGDRGEDSFDRPASDASEGRKDSSIGAKIGRKDEENQKLKEDLLDEWTRRVEAMYEEEHISSDSESEGRDPPERLLEKVADLGGKKKKVEIVDPPTETTDEKEGVHWLDALHAEKLSPSEFKARMDAKLQEYDRSYKSMQREDAERTARTDQWRHLTKKIAAARKRRMELLARHAAWNAARKRKPKASEYESAEEEQRAGQRRYNEAFYQNKANMDKVSSWGQWKDGDDHLVHNRGAAGGGGERLRPSAGGRCPIHNEPHSPGSAIDHNIPWDKISHGMKMMGASGGGERIAPYAGGQRPFHNEPESPLSAAEDTKVSNVENDNDASSIRPDAGGRCPFSNEPQPETPVGAAEHSKPWDKINDEINMAGAGGGGARISPYAGGRRPFHGESESSFGVAEELREQMEQMEQMEQNEQKKDSSSIPEDAIQNYPLSFSDVIVNDPNPQNYGVEWSWKRIFVIIVTGMLLGALAVRLKPSTYDRWNHVEKPAWGLGKTID